MTARSTPCPCGSGRKYKKCCGALPEAVPGQGTSSPDDASVAKRIKALDMKLFDEIMRFAPHARKSYWMQGAFDVYGDGEGIDEPDRQLAVPWAVYHYVADGDTRSLARQFRDERGTRLSPDLRELLDANLRAHISLYDVRRVDRGIGFAVVDLFTGDEHFIHEIRASQSMKARDVLLGSVVSVGGIAFLTALHPRVLGPAPADGALRDFLDIRHEFFPQTPIDAALLTDPGVQIDLIDHWRMAVEDFDTRAMPVVTNTDGEPLMVTTDHFTFRSADRGAIIKQLAALPGAEPPEQGDDGLTWVMVNAPGNAQHKSWDATLLARIPVDRTSLRIETNSTARADRIRDAVIALLGPLVTFRTRVALDQAALAANAKLLPAEMRDEGPPPPEVVRAIREMKASHMAEWPDQPIPALGGLTPRAAAASSEMRPALELLLRDMENDEARSPEHLRFDLSALRAELGLGR